MANTVNSDHRVVGSNPHGCGPTTGSAGHSVVACPRCQSVQTASRRSLFRRLMQDQQLSRPFDWYHESAPRACPPKSVFMLLGAVLLAMSLPALLLWALGYNGSLKLLAGVSAALLLCLLVDMQVTYRHYRDWCKEWLCGGCQRMFRYP